MKLAQTSLALSDQGGIAYIVYVRVINVKVLGALWKFCLFTAIETFEFCNSCFEHDWKIKSEVRSRFTFTFKEQLDRENV